MTENNTGNTVLKQTLETASKIKYDIYLTGLTEETVRQISQAQNEPEWMLHHRLECLKIFREMEYPVWGPDISGIIDMIEDDDSELVRYAKPSSDSGGYANSWDEVPDEIKEKFERLGIPEAERKYLAGAGGQFDSQTVYHQIKEKRAKQGIIFEDMAKALQTHGDLIKKYFMKLVPATDHKFAALHGAVWS